MQEHSCLEYAEGSARLGSVKPGEKLEEQSPLWRSCHSGWEAPNGVTSEFWQFWELKARIHSTSNPSNPSLSPFCPSLCLFPALSPGHSNSPQKPPQNLGSTVRNRIHILFHASYSTHRTWICPINSSRLPTHGDSPEKGTSGGQSRKGQCQHRAAAASGRSQKLHSGVSNPLEKQHGSHFSGMLSALPSSPGSAGTAGSDFGVFI